MSLIFNKNKKFNKKKFKKFNNNEAISLSSVEEKNLDFNTISTIEKDRLSKRKNVSFKGVEIIEVESYKEYNQIPILSFESLESNCSKAYGDCNCDIF